MYVTSRTPHDSWHCTPEPLHDLVFNYKVIDTGLFAFAAGGYYASLYCGSAPFEDGAMAFGIRKP